MDFNIAVIPGDGIGPEIVAEAQKVLDTVGKKFGHSFSYTEVDMGGVSTSTECHLQMKHWQQRKLVMQYFLELSEVSWERIVGMIYHHILDQRQGCLQLEKA